MTQDLIRHEKRAFRKRPLNQRNLETPALCFTVEGKHFENRAMPCGVPARAFLKHKSKMAGHIIEVVSTEHIWCVFRQWKLVFKFPVTYSLVNRDFG